MDLLIADGSVPLAQADIVPPSGVAQYATSGNPALNVVPTVDAAYHANMTMAELVHLVQAAGLTTSGTDWTQLARAVALIGRRVALFDAAGTYTWTVPAYITRPMIRMWGPGGGGGGSSVAAGCAVGAGAGGLLETALPCTPGDVLTLVIGAPGTGGTTSGTNGVAGGAVTISRAGAVILAVNGGNGGAGSTGGVTTGGAQGGAATDNLGFAHMLLQGQSGAPGLQGGNSAYYGGQGGAAPRGGGIGRTSNTGTTSDAGLYPGGGGNGAGGVATGGAGALGRVEIWY